MAELYLKRYKSILFDFKHYTLLQLQWQLIRTTCSGFKYKMDRKFPIHYFFYLKVA